MHNSPAVSSAKSFDLTSTAFLIVAFLTGIAGALQTPILSIFLTDEVHARPAMVGFFFTGSAVIGILVSQFLAGRSDKRGDRKSLIVFCCLLGVLACTLFAWNRNYFVLLFVGVDSIGQRNSYVKTWGCGGFLNETNIYSRGKSLCF